MADVKVSKRNRIENEKRKLCKEAKFSIIFLLYDVPTGRFVEHFFFQVIIK